MIKVHCPHCQADIRCDDRYAGRVVGCPKCKKQVSLPGIAQPRQARATACSSPPPRRTAPKQLDTPPPILEDLSWLSTGAESNASGRVVGRSKPRRRKTNSASYVMLLAGVVVFLFIGCIMVWALTSDSSRRAVVQSTPQTGESKEDSSAVKPAVAKPSNTTQKKEEMDRLHELQAKEEEQRLQELRRQAEREQERQAKVLVELERRNGLLAALEQKKTAAIAPLMGERDEYAETITQLKKKIADIKRRAGVKARSSGITVINMNSGLDVGGALAQAEKLEKEIEKATASLNAVELRINAQNRSFWVAERNIMWENSLPDEPKYSAYLGTLYTESELQMVKQYMEEHGSARGAADVYIQELKEKGVVEAFAADGNPILNSVEGCVPYQVRYVSRGGTVMQRRAWVTVKAMNPSQLGPLPGGVFLPVGLTNGKYWYVPRTAIAGSGELWNLTFSEGPSR